MATRAPWLASARAVAAPMPWLAPVISTTFPANPGSIILLIPATFAIAADSATAATASISIRKP